MKRLLIYCIYDKEGIVDDYILYFLKSFKPYCEEICVVANGFLSDSSKQKLQNLCNKIVERENSGFDSAAYKHIIEQYGYEKLKEYDELILSNDTFYGPIFSPKEMFEKMNGKNVDFWGITRHYATDGVFAGVKVEEHIQSYFLAFEKNILQSNDFEQYWSNLKPASNWEEAVAYFELTLTKFFEQKGYKSETYIPSEKYKSKFNSIVYSYYLNQQIEEDKMPFVKKKLFAVRKNNLLQNIEKGINYTLDYIKNSTDYDVNLIIQNIKRTTLKDVSEKKVQKNYLKFLLCRFFIFWKKEHYSEKLKAIIELKKLLKKI